MHRPAAVTTFGILNIFFAVFGVVGLAASMAMLAMPETTANPVVQIMRNNPAFATWMKISVPLGAVACIVLLAAGIGLLRMKEWGRKLSLAYAVYAIIAGLAGTLVTFIFVIRPLLEKAQTTQGPEAAGAVGGAIGGSVGGCFSLIYPVLLLIFMTRPKLVAAFRSPQEPPELPTV